MFLREDTKTIVGTVAYLIGVRQETWRVNYDYFCEGLYDKLESNKNALVIRCLCRLHTRLMLNFKKTDDAIRFEMRNIYNQEWFDQDDIKKLQKNGVEPILTNKRASDYTTYFNRLINEKIQNCKPLFPDWVKWEYIKDLFMIYYQQLKAAFVFVSHGNGGDINRVILKLQTAIIKINTVTRRRM